MQFYHTVVVKMKLSNYSLSDAVSELIGWARFYNQSLLAHHQHTPYMDGVGLLQQVMNLLSDVDKTELANRFIALEASSSNRNHELRDLARKCSSYLQQQQKNALINHDSVSFGESNSYRVQYFDLCAKPFKDYQLSADASPSAVAAYKNALAVYGEIRGWSKLWTFQASVPGNSTTSGTFTIINDHKLFEERNHLLQIIHLRIPSLMFSLARVSIYP